MKVWRDVRIVYMVAIGLMVDLEISVWNGLDSGESRCRG